MNAAEYDAISPPPTPTRPTNWREFAKEIQFSLPDEYYFFDPTGDGLSSSEVARVRKDVRRSGIASAARSRGSLRPEAPFSERSSGVHRCRDGPQPLRRSLHSSSRP